MRVVSHTQESARSLILDAMAAQPTTSNNDIQIVNHEPLYDFTQVDNIRCFELNSPDTKEKRTHSEVSELEHNESQNQAVSDHSEDQFVPADASKPHIKPSDLEDIATIFDRIRLLYKNKKDVVQIGKSKGKFIKRENKD